MKKKAISLFSVHSIEGRVRIVLVTVIGIMATLCLFIVFQIQALFAESMRLQDETRAIEYYSNQFASSLNRAFTSVNLYLIFQTDNHREDAIKIFKNETHTSFEKLKEISEREELSIEVKSQINDIEEIYEKVMESFNNELTSLNKKDLRDHLNTTLVPNIILINKKAQLLATDHREKEYAEERQLHRKIDNLSIIASITFLIALISSYVLGKGVIRIIQGQIDRIENYAHLLSQGEIPLQWEAQQDEFNKTVHYLRVVGDNLRKMKSFAENSYEGKYDSSYMFFQNNGELGVALNKMVAKLKDNKQKEDEREWENKGVSLLSQVIRLHPNNLQELCEHFLEELISYTNANQGGIFVVDAEHQKLELKACFAYGRKKYIQKEVAIGDGFIGEVFRDGETMLITDVPQNYLEISSGLGKANPSSLIIVPLKSQNTIVGVMEIASFDVFALKFVHVFERVGEILAASISSVTSADQTKKLLHEAQENAKRMNTQEEKMMENTFKLIYAREEADKKIKGLERAVEGYQSMFQQNVCGIILCDITGKIQFINESGLNLFGYSVHDAVENTSVSRFSEGLKGLNRHYKEDLRKSYFSVHEAVRKDGKIVHIQALISKIDQDNEQKFIILVSRKHPAIHENVHVNG